MAADAILYPPRDVAACFARIYYSVVNKDPENLHLFYANSATMSHGYVLQDGQKKQAISKDVRGEDIRDSLSVFSQLKGYRAVLDIIQAQYTVAGALLAHFQGCYKKEGMQSYSFSQDFVIVQETTSEETTYMISNDILLWNENPFSANSSETPSSSIPVEAAVEQVEEHSIVEPTEGENGEMDVDNEEISDEISEGEQISSIPRSYASALSSQPAVVEKPDSDVKPVANSVPPRRQKDSTPMPGWIFVRPLPVGKKEKELTVFFEKIGKVTSIKIQDKNFFFVHFAKVESAAAAVKASPLKYENVELSIDFRRNNRSGNWRPRNRTRTRRGGERGRGKNARET